MPIKWNFLSNQHGEIKGINDSGVATFRGAPLKSLAREICQNSLDAASASDVPVMVEFHTFSLPIEQIPGTDELKDAFERSKKYWGAQKTSQTREFFDNALQEFDKGNIDVLRISDFNTKGLSGSREAKDTDWTNLTKSSGVSDKPGTAGGSYGIGKYATFACSKFSTVYYSTYDINNEQAYQGVSRIVTFERSDGEETTGLGFYGEDLNKPVYEQLNLDPKFSRKLEQYGTDIYVMSFAQAQSDWKREIILSILDGFFVAFWKNKLKVIVENVEISKATLADLMEEYKESIDGYVYGYYKVLNSQDSKWVYEENFLGLGEIKFGVLLTEDDASRRIAMVRKTGMKIKDQGNISGYIPFIGVMLIEGENINTQLRLIENPQHTEWEPKRSANETQARVLLKSLNDYMKQKVEDFASKGGLQEIDAAGLGDLLPDEFEDEINKKNEETIGNDTQTIESNTIKHKKKQIINNSGKTKIKGTAIEGDEECGWQNNEPNPNPPHPHPPKPLDVEPGGTTEIVKPKIVPLNKFMFISTDKKSGKYVVNFEPATDSESGVLELFISGEVSNFPAKIIKATTLGGKSLEIENNKIMGLRFVKDHQNKVVVELEQEDYCALEVNTYEN